MLSPRDQNFENIMQVFLDSFGPRDRIYVKKDTVGFLDNRVPYYLVHANYLPSNINLGSLPKVYVFPHPTEYAFYLVKTPHHSAAQYLLENYARWAFGQQIENGELRDIHDAVKPIIVTRGTFSVVMEHTRDYVLNLYQG